MNVLIDMGNSRLKWATETNSVLEAGLPLTYGEYLQQQLTELWMKLEAPISIGIACVNSDDRLQIIQRLAASIWPDSKVKIITPKAQSYGLTIAYNKPEKLGVDRWLALLAAGHFFPRTDCCIVDCGTAVTIDLLNTEGLHLGGLIMPGFNLMKASLAQETTNLGLIDSHHAIGLANSTEAGIYNGTLLAIVGLIGHVMSKNPSFQLILTGGDAALVAEQLERSLTIQPNLVLQGLAVAINDKQNFHC